LTPFLVGPCSRSDFRKRMPLTSISLRETLNYERRSQS
jgi:hypothetical protein